MCGSSDSECSPKNFLFSNTEAWRLYSPENRHSRPNRIFYLIWRWFWAVFFVTFIVLSGALPQSWYADESQRVKWFLYLTDWAFLLFCLSQLVNAVVVTVHFQTKTKGNSEPKAVRWYLKLNWFLYIISSSPAILVTLLFWFLLFSPGYPFVIDTPITHGVNAIFVLLDVWVTAMPITVLQFYIPTLFGLTYVIFSVIYDLAGGTNALRQPYIYEALDWSDGSMATMVIQGVASVVSLAALHFILFGLHKLRIFIYKKCIRNTQDDKMKRRYVTAWSSDM